MSEYISKFTIGDDRFVADIAERVTFNEEYKQLKRTVIIDAAPRHYAEALQVLERTLQEIEFHIPDDRKQVLNELEKVNKLIEDFPFGRDRGKLSIHAKIDNVTPEFNALIRRARTNLKNWLSKRPRIAG